MIKFSKIFVTILQNFPVFFMILTEICQAKKNWQSKMRPVTILALFLQERFMSQKLRLFNVIGPICAASIFIFGILSHIQAVKGITKIRASLSAASEQINSSSLSGLLEKINNSASWGMLLCSVGAALLVVMLVSRNKSQKASMAKTAEELGNIKL